MASSSETNSKSGDENSDDDCSLSCDASHVDAVIAKNLNALSFEERNIVLEDIHGVRSLPSEERMSSRINESLEQMSIALDGIEQKPAFDEAARLNSHYILWDKKFRIQFLRAEEFDAKKAAQRLVNYLEFYLELFGPIALTRPIYIKDLNKDEQKVLRDGVAQLFPSRDRSGRRILSKIGRMGGPEEMEFSVSFNRIVMYMLQVLASDETTQQFGYVMIFLSSRAAGELDFLKESNVKANIRKLIFAMPVRMSAFHICFPDTPNYRFAAATLSLIAPSAMRVRIRVHVGSETEIRYCLQSYGIPGNQVPITSTGRIKTSNHQRWIKYQREKEETLKMGLLPFDGVDCPELMDVLLGNTGYNISFKNNPGNIMYNEVLDRYFNKYDTVSEKGEKTRITWMVLEALIKACGRLLVWDRRGWWSIASTDKVREKISHDFRRKRLTVLKEYRKRPSDPVGVDSSTDAFIGLGVTEKKKRCLDNQNIDRSNSSNDDCSFDPGCFGGS